MPRICEIYRPIIHGHAFNLLVHLYWKVKDEKIKQIGRRYL
jgi:hypothetical protein